MRGLGAILRQHICGDRFDPSFFLQENYGSQEEKQWEIAIDDMAIDNMCQRGVFALPGGPIQVELSSPTSLARISLCLQTGSYETTFGYGQNTAIDGNNLLSISGFPRVLYPAQGIMSPSLSVNSKEELYEAKESTVSAPPLDHAHSEPSLSRLRTNLAKRPRQWRGHSMNEASPERSASQTTLHSIAELDGNNASSLKSVRSWKTSLSSEED